MLALDANAKQRVLDLIDALTLRARGHVREHHPLSRHHERRRTRLNIAATTTRCATSPTISGSIALGIEDGDLSAAEKRLRQAQQAL